jgi:hypothetical protein
LLAHAETTPHAITLERRRDRLIARRKRWPIEHR